ncbi:MULTISPECIES: stage V sporulation protein K [unclassified Thermoactinomyces]|jgi:stage V sporulation protein K|uniref:Stage V sporulation protein K n=1 Tax=Thermoactinomyces daqus TaxID=1329516 RepID=A0A7W1X8W0_9BACL|nr:stage V sporulation protein K [Thermoactinomyces daqus]MBH8598335.1 stage V sporulation protein K [Thermoactinomyces sp. CICC 10523]MBH8604459.1 stage V sporulation protein K [Thermoactinomyces sp. CICC 10522]MBH8607541.1 stage V sporulation protein K [Thermoactinomyces sp. CICC 10521]
MNRRVLKGINKSQIHVVFDHPRQEMQISACPAALKEEAFVHEEHGPLRDCMEQLKHLVGLSKIKEFVKEIYAWLEIGKRRRAAGLAAEQQVLHMIFSGNPGTGKTTVARILSRLFKEMGVLSKGHLVEVERADLVGEYIGHTAQKTREHVKKALGGILFIDEAYSLARGGEKDFGKEAIDTMVKSMEDYKNDFILILAGYSEEMEQFLRLNPGLPSRFPIHLQFPDFHLDELMEIAEQMVQERQYRLSLTAQEKLRQHLKEQMERRDEQFGNARHVRNLVEQAIRNQAVRLLNLRYASKDDLMMLRGEDFQFREAEKNPPVYSWYNERAKNQVFL